MVKEVKLEKADFEGSGKAREVLRRRTMVFLRDAQVISAALSSRYFLTVL